MGEMRKEQGRVSVCDSEQETETQCALLHAVESTHIDVLVLGLGAFGQLLLLGLFHRLLPYLDAGQLTSSEREGKVRPVRYELDERCRGTGSLHHDRVRSEMHDGQRLVLVVILRSVPRRGGTTRDE